MDKELTHAILVALFTTVPVGAISAIVSWKIAAGQLNATVRQQIHTEEKDDKADERELIERYRQLWQDEKARADSLQAELSKKRR